MNSVEVLRKLISFDTTISKDTLDAVSFVREYLEEHGAKVHLVYNDSKTRASIVGTIGDEEEAGIILSGHLDTVSSNKDEWTTDPHILTEVGSRFYGRGTSDMKGGIACALSNIEHLKQSKKTFHFVFTHDEEGGFSSIKQLVQNNFDGFFKHKPLGCIVMEPTMLKPICGHKGTYLGKINVTGIESHSAYPHLGVDAISYLVHTYNEIKNIFEKEEFTANDSYFPKRATLDICTINGGDAVNKIAGSAELTYILRYLPSNNISSLNSKIKSFCNSLDKEIKTKNPNTGVVFTEVLDVKSFETNRDSDFVKKFSEPSYVSYGTEAGYFQSIGIDTVVFGPGSIEQAHVKNEFIEKSQLEAFDKFLKSI